MARAWHAFRFVAGMDDVRKLLKVIRHFDTAMLVTHDPAGGLRARPLSLAGHDPDGTLWFFTAHDSGKVWELAEDARTAVVMQGRRRYVSLSGFSELVSDRPKIRKLWRESFRPWFPNGPEDATAALLRVKPERAEFWDMSGLSGVQNRLRTLGALLRRKRASDGDTSFHRKVFV
jgi:general stress protein 26